AATDGAHRRGLGHRVRGVVRPLGMDIRPQPRDEPVGRVLVEDEDMIDVAQGGEDLGALLGGHHRSSGALETRHRGVAVDADEEHVAESACGVQVPQVTDVQEIEAAVGEDDTLALRAQAGGELRRLVDRHGPSAGPRACDSSSFVTVAVPRFMTTSPPATLARDAASTAAAAPGASASVNVPMTVSPAPVTSAISSVPKMGMKVEPPSRSRSASPWLPRVTSSRSASRLSSSSRPALSTVRSSSTGSPVSS